MKRRLLAAFFALGLALPALPAFDELPAQAQQARVVSNCGNLAPFGAQPAGGQAFPTIDTTGKLCLSGGGGGGSLVGGTTPVTGTCPSGQFLYNNAGVLGCSASSTSIVLPQTVSGTVNSGGIPYFNTTTQMSSSATLTLGALITGGGSGASPVGLADVATGSYLKSGGVTTIPAWQAFGAGVQAAVALNANAAGGVALVSAVPTAGNFVKWAAGGLVDGGAGSGGGTITANSTPTSGFTAGQAIYSDGSLAQAAGSYYSANMTQQRNGVTAQAERVYNTYTDASNGEWGTFDFTTTANQLTIGTQKNGTGTTRDTYFVNGGATYMHFYTGGGWVFIDSPSGLDPITAGQQLGGGGNNAWGVTTSDVFQSGTSYPGIFPTITPGGTCGTAGAKAGGNSAGTFTLSAACTAGNTIVFTGMRAVATGFACDMEDRTKPTAIFAQTAATTTGFTVTVGAVVNGIGDTLQYKCMGY